jgi:hypothetical protein
MALVQDLLVTLQLVAVVAVAAEAAGTVAQLELAAVLLATETYGKTQMEIRLTDLAVLTDLVKACLVLVVVLTAVAVVAEAIQVAVEATGHMPAIAVAVDHSLLVQT